MTLSHGGKSYFREVELFLDWRNVDAVDAGLRLVHLLVCNDIHIDLSPEDHFTAPGRRGLVPTISIPLACLSCTPWRAIIGASQQGSFGQAHLGIVHTVPLSNNS
jgi:hypothetical protein